MEERENSLIQPLDALMTRLGLSNADLVGASTEQLSFKMVQKGRKGRRLTPNIQEKILNALMKLEPDLKVRRRELFHYPMEESAVGKIDDAIAQIAAGKIRYPQLVDLLVGAGLNHYAVDVAANKITFYGSGGEVYFLESPTVSAALTGAYDSAKIHEAGILTYEVNLRQRKIVYKGETESHREDIPLSGAMPEPIEVKPAKPAKVKKEKKPRAIPAKSKIIPKKRKRPGVIRTTTKARVAARKRYFRKKKKGRRR